MFVQFAGDEGEWESFLLRQSWSPFLQSWMMGEVYREIGEEPLRLEVRDGEKIVGICQAVVVNARRGKHLAVMYGPVIEAVSFERGAVSLLIEELKKVGRKECCTFIRMSPFWVSSSQLIVYSFHPAPLHMLAEHVWYLNLRGKTENEILMGMRKTTRNLVRRAEREGVEVRVSDNPLRDLQMFLKLHSETKKRHHFTPYPDRFFRAQVEKFAPKGQCLLYLASYQGEVIASSIHMVYGGETSYHHGASSSKYPHIPASYLLQWWAIQDALKRGDRIYNFWGVAPEGVRKHPFAGVTMFKTGFGGELLTLQHCMDLPLSSKYWLTRMIETVRKWRRGF